MKQPYWKKALKAIGMIETTKGTSEYSCAANFSISVPVKIINDGIGKPLEWLIGVESNHQMWKRKARANGNLFLYTAP